MHSRKQSINKMTFLKYTGLFLIISAIIFSVFMFNGKSFIWEGDGFHQHYPFFREYLTILRTFFETGNLQSWDWTIGVGADTLLTYGYYVVGDPFVYLGLLFPKGQEELAFHLIMFVRIWTVGASFLLYARAMKFSEKNALAATIMYTFSHFVIYNVVRHPFFIHPLIFFPMIAVGIEKIYRKESGIIFAVSIGLSASSNFYFFYMLSLLSFLYAVIRYGHYEKWTNWSGLWRKFLTFFGLYLLGLLLSAAIFLPQVYGLLNASRSAGLPPVSLLVYPLHYYGLLLINMITPGTIFWAVGGFSMVAVLAVPYLIINRSTKKILFSVLVFLSILLLFPFFGSLMNGFSGPYNRFTFVFPFYLAIFLVYFLDHVPEMTTTELRWIKRLLFGLTAFYGGISLLTGQFFLYLSPIFIGWVTYYILTNYRTHWSFERIIILLVALNMTTNALNFYLPYGKNAISETEDYGTVDENYQQVFRGVEQNLPEEEWYRVSVTSKDNHLRNQYAFLDVKGMNSYASLSNGAVAEFSQMLENSQYQIIQPLRNGIDDRRIANQALGVKYILTDEAHVNYIPADYEVNESLSESGMIVVETKNYTPFAYVEADVVLETELEELHPVQRESLLAEAVILEEVDESLNTTTNFPAFVQHDFIITGEDGVSFEDEESVTVEVTEANSALTLSVDQPERLIGQEVFLFIEGIDYQPLENRLFVQESTQFRLNAEFNQQQKRILQSDRFRFSSYFKRENILIHFNEVTELEEALLLKFENTGFYNFDAISLVSRSYNQEESAALAVEKQNRALTLDTFTNEYVSGTINNEKAGFLVTSIPYSTGWSVFVNGEEMPIEKVNVGFLGLYLPAGDQTVEFVYETPYLKLGFGLTVVGFISIGGLFVHDRRKSKKKLYF